MKKILLLVVLVIIAHVTYAQCTKILQLKSEKMYRVNEDGSNGRSKDFSSTITIGRDSMLMHLVNEEDGTMQMIGIIKHTTCNMNATYSDGNILYKVEGVKRNGQNRDFKMIITIEAKAGKIKFFTEKDEAGRDPEKTFFELTEQKVL